MPITCQSHAHYIQIACHHIQIACLHIQITRHHIQIARPQHALYTPIECPSQVNTEEVEQESFLLYPDASSTTYRGLAISMENAGGSEVGYVWSDTKGHQCVSQISGPEAYDTKDGIASTDMLVTSNGNYMAGAVCFEHDHAAAKAARNFSTSRPAGASDWFLPTIGQWNMIVKGLATKKEGQTVSVSLNYQEKNQFKASNLNSVITGAGGTALDGVRYWSATEQDNWYIFIINFYWGESEYHDRTSSCCVRPVFAF